MTGVRARPGGVPFRQGGIPLLRAVARMSAAFTGAAVAVAALAVPASADGYVPDGCVGSVAFACTGNPPSTGGTIWDAPVKLPVTVTAPSVQVLPSRTVAGTQVGGVIVGVGPGWTPGPTVVVGPTQPTPTGVVLPVDVCAFTTCLQAGTPVVVPGLPLPVVPVSVPSVPTPGLSVPVPVVTVPGATTPAASTPAVDEHVVTIALYVDWFALYEAAVYTCEMGGGEVRSAQEFPYSTQCTFSPTMAAANALFLAYDAARTAHHATHPVVSPVRTAALRTREDVEREIADRLDYLLYMLSVAQERVP